MRRKSLALLFTMFLVCGGVQAVYASTITTRLLKDRAHVSLHSTLSQNMTSLFERRIAVAGESLTDVVGALEREIKKHAPAASVGNILVSPTFSNNTIEVKIEFDVLGVVTASDEVLTGNLSWRAFDILDDLHSEGVSYNLVGRAHFSDVAARYENMSATRFYENRTLPVTKYRALDIIGNITMLRFGSLQTQLRGWERHYNATGAETTYRLNVGRIVDLVARRELNGSAVGYGVWAELVGEVVVSGSARDMGDIIVSEIGVGTLQILMLASVAAPILFGIGVCALERKVGARIQGKRK